MKPVLLMVDDEPELLELLSTLFEGDNFETLSAPNISAAWDILSARHVDVVLSDHSMPGGSGLKLLEKINTRPVNERPAFFLMTGHMGDAIDQDSTPGITGVFSKPMDIDNVAEAIRKVLTTKR